MPTPPPDPWLAYSDPFACVVRPTPIGVYKFNDADGANPAQALTPMPGVECLAVKWPGGAEPRSAMLRYRLGAPGTGPHALEDALASRSGATGVLGPNDRVVVLAFAPDGSSIPLFDGTPVGFTGKIEGDDRGGCEDVFLACVGIERRAQDTPMPGMFCRDGDDPAAVSDVQTAIPAVFNPRGQPNCTPLNSDHTNLAGDPYPTFLDTAIAGRTAWTLPRAVAYLIYHHNEEEKYVGNPERADLDKVLVARLPKADGTPFNPVDPAAYDARDIVAPNTPFTGRDWLKTAEQLVANKGFLFNLRLDGSGPGGTPRTTLEIAHWQAGAPRVILLQPAGSDLDGRLSNVGGCTLTRDTNEAVTAVEVRGHAHRWQASFVLECGFPSGVGDAVPEENIEQFSTTVNGGEPGPKYRDYIFGETGEAYYRPTSGTPITAIPSLDVLFGAPDPVTGRTYAHRRRPGSNKLLPVGTAPAARAILEYSINYAGAAPAVYGSPGATGGGWTPIHGGWHVMDDKLGIRVTVNNPNEWIVGRDSDGAPLVLHGVEAQAVNGPTDPAFHLKLTTYIEADAALLGGADPRPTAVVGRTIARQVDARDRYYLDRSYVAGGPPNVYRDDTEAATSEAIAHRDGLDSGCLDGPVVIPRFVGPPTYDIGHRITELYGRKLGLRTDGGADGDFPIYPVVRSIEWHFGEDRQETVLLISDASNARTRRNKHRLPPVALGPLPSDHQGVPDPRRGGGRPRGAPPVRVRGE